MFQRHGLFAAALLLGVVVRVVAMLGFRSAAWFPDSFQYVGLALRLQPDPARPIGYPVLLALLEPFGSFALVTAVQHLLGLAVAVLLYALLRRGCAPAWLATVAVLPPLLDGNQVRIEHMILSETLFTFLITSGLVALLWHRTPSMRAAAAAGALLAAGGLVRLAGLPVLALAGIYSLLRLPGRRTCAVGGLAATLLLVGYATWFWAVHGQFALTSRSVLQSRAALATQPGDYVRAALVDFGRAFSWSPQPFPTPGHLEAYRFSRHPLRIPTAAVYVPGSSATADTSAYEGGPADTRIVPPYADWMIAYQRYVTLRGPMLAALLLFGALSLGGIRRGASALRPAMLLWSASMLLLLAPPLLTTFDHRYVLPAVPLAAAAAGCVAAVCLRRG